MSFEPETPFPHRFKRLNQSGQIFQRKTQKQTVVNKRGVPNLKQPDPINEIMAWIGGSDMQERYEKVNATDGEKEVVISWKLYKKKVVAT